MVRNSSLSLGNCLYSSATIASFALSMALMPDSEMTPVLARPLMPVARARLAKPARSSASRAWVITLGLSSSSRPRSFCAKGSGCAPRSFMRIRYWAMLSEQLSRAPCLSALWASSNARRNVESRRGVDRLCAWLSCISSRSFYLYVMDIVRLCPREGARFRNIFTTRGECVEALQ